MLISKKSNFTGEIHQREIEVTQDQLDTWNRGGLIQNVMPHLSADDREFLMTGVTPEEWNATFGGNETELEYNNE